MSEHREWDMHGSKELEILRNEHNATVRAYRDAMAECDRLGKANNDACDRIAELESERDDLRESRNYYQSERDALESRPVLTWEECLDEWENMNGRFGRIHHYLDWLKSRLPAPVRGPFSGAQIDAMAKAHMSVISPCANWEHADKQYYMNAQRAALAAGGLVPCAVPEYAPEDVALMPELALLRQKVENQRMQLHNLERREESRKFAAQFAGRASDEELGEALRRELGMEGLPRPVRAAAAVRARVEAPLLAEIERLDIENRDRAFYVEQFAAVSKERDTLKARVAELEDKHGNALHDAQGYKDDYERTRAELEAMKSERYNALRQRDTVPAKVRWGVTAANVYNTFQIERAAGRVKFWSEWVMDYLAAHAVIDVPAGVPSVEELDAIADEAYSAAAKQSSSAKVRQTAMLTAIRDEVLRGMGHHGAHTYQELHSMLQDVVSVLDLSELALEKHGPHGSAPVEMVREVLARKDKEIALLKRGFVDAAPPVWTDEQIEALARVLEASADMGFDADGDGLYADWDAQARAAFAHIGAPKPAPIKCIFCDFEGKSLADLKEHSAKCEKHPLWPTPIAAPDVLEQLAEIAEAEEEATDSWVCAVEKVLRAAQAYVDCKWTELCDAANYDLDGNKEWSWTRAINFANSRIRYRVALPETPKELPSVNELEAVFDAGRDDGALVNAKGIEAILTTLRPWLHEPTGWELDVTAREIHDTCTTRLDGYQAVLDLCRSRIRPTFECAECAKRNSKCCPCCDESEKYDGEDCQICGFSFSSRTVPGDETVKEIKASRAAATCAKCAKIRPWAEMVVNMGDAARTALEGE